jgi:hypothetical protein
MPAIKSEVPIGYRINGDEMLSIIPTTGESLAHLVPIAGSAFLTVRGRAFPQIFQADGRRTEFRRRQLPRSIPIPGVVANGKGGMLIRPSSYRHRRQTADPVPLV